MESYGYRFDTPDRSVVIAGDTNPTDETIKACNGCDVLVHEGRALEMVARLPEGPRAFVAKFHTTSEQLAALATKAKPGLLIVYHSSLSWWEPSTPSADRLGVIGTGELHSTPDVLQREIASRYSGHFVIGRDLDVY